MNLEPHRRKARRARPPPRARRARPGTGPWRDLLTDAAGPGSRNVVDGRPNRLSRRRACHTDAAVAPAGASELAPPSPERRAGDTEVTGQLHASRVAEAQQPSTSAAAGGSPSLQRARLWRPAAGPGPE